MRLQGKLFHILFLVVLFQPVIGQLVPDKPTLYIVTVDPETRNDVITWYSSPSPNIDYYIVAISTMPNPDEPYVMQPIATVYPPDTVFVNTNSESASRSVGYTVWAVNDLGGNLIYPSLFDEPDSTMHLEVSLDQCVGSITLNWNDYNHWRGSTNAFNIYRILSSGIYELLGTVPGDSTSIILNNIEINQQYDLFVEAVHSDNVRRSTSNVVGVLTSMTQQPVYINADYATIGPDNTVNLSFTLDASTNLSDYMLLRSKSPTGPFDTIAEINTDDSQFTYNDAVSFTSAVYYYRLEIINNCGSTSARSNLANNIILNGTLDGHNIVLGWNSYLDWAGGVENYSVIRTSGLENPAVDTVNAGILTSFNDDISNMTDHSDPVSSLLCYQILATENMNMYGIQGKSLSNRICFSITPNIRMPNAFIPNDLDLVNQVFEPVFSFLPERYEMIIYNRLGEMVWKGTGPWDGRVNGRFVPEGVYLYYLRVYNYSPEFTELNGKVTVVYR
jgi:hypothetical protein